MSGPSLNRGHYRADRSALINTWPMAGSLLQEQGAEVSHPTSNIHFLSFLSSWLSCQTKLLDTFHSATAQKASQPLAVKMDPESPANLFHPLEHAPRYLPSLTSWAEPQ